MELQRNRFFVNDATAELKHECITWVKVEETDPRSVQLDGEAGFWIPTCIQNQGFDISTLDHVYDNSGEMFFVTLDDGSKEQRTRRGKVISYTRMDAYAKGILAGFREISYQEYNEIIVGEDT